jgi:hypothetical protein
LQWQIPGQTLWVISKQKGQTNRTEGTEARNIRINAVTQHALGHPTLLDIRAESRIVFLERQRIVTAGVEEIS